MFDVKHLYSKKNCDINGATSGSKYTKSNFSKFYFLVGHGIKSCDAQRPSPNIDQVPFKFISK